MFEIGFAIVCALLAKVCIMLLIIALVFSFSEVFLVHLYHFLTYVVLKPMQIAFTFMVYPSLLLAYMGQAAYLSQHHPSSNEHPIGFYVSVPGRF